MNKDIINKLIYELDDVIPPKKIHEFRAELAPLSDETYHKIIAIEHKKSFTALLLAIFLGFLGINRFYIKQYFWGILKLALTILVAVLMLFQELDFLPKVGLLLVYAIVYLLDIGFSFTSCRYINLKNIRKAIRE